MTLSTTGLVAVLLVAIAMIVVLIVVFKLHGSIALTIASIFTAAVTGVSPGNIGKLLEKGVGDTLGFLILIIGFGAILGKMLEVSGGAERLAKTMLKAFGEKRAPMVMTFLGLIAGIPVFVEVGFVLLVPLVFVVAKEVGCSKMRVGVPLAISLMIVHCILPPHPAATAIAGTLKADIGTVIMLGLVVGIPASLIGGPLYTKLALRKNEKEYIVANPPVVPGNVNRPAEVGGQLTEEVAHAEEMIDEQPTKLPGFGNTLFTILLPLLIMVTRTISDQTLPKGNGFHTAMSLIGHPIVALLISVLYAYCSLGLLRGLRLEKLSGITDGSFGPIGGVLLIIGAGGAFNEILKESGIAEALATAMKNLPISPIILAWLIALILHFAVGSATVAMISAAGIVEPMLHTIPGLSPVIIALAVGAGAIGLTHVTDSLFWLYKEFMGISVGEALKTLTIGTTIASVVALCSILIIHIFI